MRHAVRLAGDPGVQEQCGPWSVSWRPAGFCVRPIDGLHGGASFVYSRIVLPVEIVVGPMPDDTHALLKLDPFARVEILKGASRAELERFQRRVSSEVFAALRTSPAGCADCSSESGLIPMAWENAVCPGCREFYCRSPRCLRRLRVVVLRNGARLCKFCGVENDHGVAPRSEVHGATS